MTSYDQTKMNELEHTSTEQRSITSENRRKRWQYMVCWSPTKI